MTRHLPQPRDAASGYTRLLWVDPTTGRDNGSENIFVPLGLAEVINPARRELYDNRTRADTWDRACAIQTPQQPPEDKLNLDPDESIARLRATRVQVQASAAMSSPPAGPPPSSLATPAANARPSPAIPFP